MSRNSHDAALALHAADAALASAEAWLDVNGDPNDPRLYGTRTRYGDAAAWRDETVWATRGQALRPPFANVAEPPRFLIEWVTTYETEVEPPSGIYVDVFRITARGIGSQPTTVVQLQSTYARTRDGGPADVRTGRLSWVELES